MGSRMLGTAGQRARIAIVAVCACAAVAVGAMPALASDGDLDPSFGVHGTALYDFETADNESISRALTEAVLPDGKIIVAGSNGSDMLAVRLTSAGALDPTFGTGGAVDFNVHVFEDEDDSYVKSVLVEPDGDVLLVGDAQYMPSYPVIIRLLPDGALDPSFGNDGKVILDVADVEAAALAPNGDVMLAGTGSVYSPSCVMLTAVTPSGALDRGFGSGGTVCYQADTELPGDEQSAASAVLVQRDGNIDVLGNGLSDTEVGATNNGFIAQFTPEGVLNPSFGHGGVAALAIPGVDGPRAEALALQADGDLVAVGSGTTLDNHNTVDVLRFTTDGQPDASFGSGGVNELVGGDYPAIDEAGDSVAIRPDGNIFVSGSTDPYGQGPTDAWLLSSSGQVNSSFAGGEAVLTGDLTTDQAEPDNSVLLAGAAPAGNNYFDLAVTHLLGPGESTLPADPGSTSVATTPSGTAGPGTTSSTTATGTPPAGPGSISPGPGGAGPTTVGSAPIVVPRQYVQPPIRRITLHCTRIIVAGQPRMGTCTVTFVSVTAGDVTDELLEGHRLVAQSRQHIRSGTNHAVIRSRKRLAAGRYRLLITLHASGGRTSASAAAVRLP